MAKMRYRYLFAFAPSPDLRCLLAWLGDVAGQGRKRIDEGRLHLTLCVIAELAFRDRFIVRRVAAAFNRHLPSSCSIRLGIVRGGRKGATIRTIGSQREIQSFYLRLTRLLAELQLSPLHRKSGLRPHITLGYDRCAFEPFKVLWEWVPSELLLIESEVGRGIHNVLRRWPLLPSPQLLLPFDTGVPISEPVRLEQRPLAER